MLDSLIGPQRTPPHQPSTHTYRLSKFLKNPPHPQRRSEILKAFIPTVNSPASRFHPRKPPLPNLKHHRLAGSQYQALVGDPLAVEAHPTLINHTQRFGRAGSKPSLPQEMRNP